MTEEIRLTSLLERTEHQNLVLRAIRNVNKLIVQEKDPAQLIQRACELLVETRGYRGAWIMLEQASGREAIATSVGWDERWTQLHRRTEQGMAPRCLGLARGSRRPVVVSDPEAFCAGCPLLAVEQGCYPCVAGLWHDGHCFGVLGVSVPQRFELDAEEQSLVEEVAGDLAFALQFIEQQQVKAQALAALEQSTRRLEEAQRIGRLGFWEWEIETGELFWSDRVYELLGLDPGRTEPSHERFLQAVHPDDRERVKQTTKETLEQRGEADLDYRVAAPSAELRHVHEHCEVVCSPDGQPQRMHGTVVDVTNRKQLQAQLAQADRMANVGLLAAGVAHEINNPLTYVLFNLESLAATLPRVANTVSRAVNELLPAQAAALRSRLAQATLDEGLSGLAEQSTEALGGVKRVRDIVRDLKTFSRVEDDQQVQVDLNSVIEAALNMAYNEIKYRARLERTLGDLPAVQGSDGRLSQVFLNLLVNAAQAMDEGDVERNRLRVRSWQQGDEVRAEVSDTGHGIAAEHLDRLFDPFFTTKERGVGSGLGLSICHNIISGYGGRIEVQSRVGQGTRFVVCLPVATAPEEEEYQEHNPTPIGIPRGRILCVDDEPMIARTVQRLLKKEHDVVLAGSGRQAQELLQQDRNFDLVLCDLMMPDVSGVDLYLWLQEHLPDLARRVVFVSGGAFTPRSRRLLEQIDCPRLDKPFDMQTFRVTVRGLLAELS